LAAGDPQDESGLLSKCPVCVYSLVGLPVQHRCPECAFEFDRRRRVFGGRILAADRKRFLQSNVIWAALVGPMFVTVTAFSLYKGVWFVPLVPIGAAALLFVIFSIPPRKFVVVAPEGVLVYRGRARIERFAWDTVRRASHDMLRKSIRLELVDRTAFIATYPVVRADLTEADACARAINATRTEHAAGGGDGRQ